MKLKILMGSILLILLAIGCNPLDKENLSAISTDDVYTLPGIAEAYVNDIYADLMPGFVPSFGQNSDEGGLPTSSAVINNFLNGTVTEDALAGENNYPYDKIRRINIFLKGIDKATFDQDIIDRLKGEVLFWRAWAYFGMVRNFGGVPLVLKPEPPDNLEAIFIPRAKTSECFVQILKDLDDAIALLPDPTGNGRIDKGAAMAFKGRVALYQASPQFNRSNNSNLWQAAYNVNKEAVTYLDGKGKGLLGNFSQIWYQEMNKEVVMVRRYSSPEASNGSFQVCIIPLIYVESGCAGGNLPTLELAQAFPMKDGSKWDPDARDYAAIFQDRDDRFYYTIAYNGASPYLKPMFGKENLWTYWYDKDGKPSTGINGKEFRVDNWNTNESGTGLYSPKMTDRNITAVNKLDGEIDWIEIRYAEVIMNLAEAANESNKPDEALQILGNIRARAGIEPGANGKYGITATTKEGVRQAIMDERFVEFAFESKRFYDLRRWRIYKSRMEGLQNSIKHRLRSEWIGSVADRPTGLKNMDEIWNQFNVIATEDVQHITMKEEDKYSFFGIPKTILDRNSKIEQNNTWGGSFDPLQ